MQHLDDDDEIRPDHLLPPPHPPKTRMPRGCYVE
jgi:hypothetical protein